jgi:hypothetical protein
MPSLAGYGIAQALPGVFFCRLSRCRQERLVLREQTKGEFSFGRTL